MKYNLLYLALVMICITGVFSCKDHALDDFTPEKTIPVTASAGSVVGDIRKDNEKITLTIGVALSEPAKKAFQIGLSLNADTINTLIENNTLQNTLPLPSATFSLPNVTTVSYGADSAFYELEINMTILERYFGKSVALAVSLVDPTKGNLTSGAKRTSVIVVDTRDVVDPDEIRYLSIANGGGDTLDVRRGQNYRVTSAGVTIPLGINLAGISGSAFVVRARVNPDTIATLVGTGKLPQGTVALAEGEYLLDTVMNMGGNKNEFTYELNIPWNIMDENADHPVAIAISLKNPTKHVLHPTDKTVVVFIDNSVNLDNNSFVYGSGTGLKAEYFIGKILDEEGATPIVVRIDERIEFDGWQPIKDRGDDWSSRWTGEFLAPVRGEYTFFQTNWDNGARLFIDGKTLVNDFNGDYNKPSRFGKIYLERGQRYTIEAHHSEYGGGQQAKLEYEVAGAIGRTIVPRSQLYPAP